MKKTAILLVACFLLIGGSSQFASAGNVALGKPASYTGAGLPGTPGSAYLSSSWNYEVPALADPSNMTDGVFLTEGTQWNHETFWWDASSYPDNSVTVDLLSDYNINRLVVQADNNDAYAVGLYLDGILQATIDVPSVSGWGMITRTLLLGSAVTADTLAFSHPNGYAGDFYYSVSEIQAFGTPIPEPASLLLVGTGLIGMAAFRRKCRK